VAVCDFFISNIGSLYFKGKEMGVGRNIGTTYIYARMRPRCRVH
jgi:hypothetical protein